MKIVDIFVTLILSSKGGKIYLIETGDSKLLAGMNIPSSVTYSLCMNNPGGNRKISSDQKKPQHDGNRIIKKGYIYSISLSCRVAKRWYPGSYSVSSKTVFTSFNSPFHLDFKDIFFVII